MSDALDELCPRCKCCSTDWQDCHDCGGEGYSHHDCGEDSCCCADPEDNVACGTCQGKGGWTICLGSCDELGHHVASVRV
jgi:hypothetical protein